MRSVGSHKETTWKERLHSTSRMSKIPPRNADQKLETSHHKSIRDWEVPEKKTVKLRLLRTTLYPRSLPRNHRSKNKHSLVRDKSYQNQYPNLHHPKSRQDFKTSSRIHLLRVSLCSPWVINHHLDRAHNLSINIWCLHQCSITDIKLPTTSWVIRMEIHSIIRSSKAAICLSACLHHLPWCTDQLLDQLPWLEQRTKPVEAAHSSTKDATFNTQMWRHSQRPFIFTVEAQLTVSLLTLAYAQRRDNAKQLRIHIRKPYTTRKRFQDLSTTSMGHHLHILL